MKESKEAIKQNCTTIENLLDNSKNINEITFNINPTLTNTTTNTTNTTNNNQLKIEYLDFKNRKLEKGQWVDVKDTINEWLEAQVIDVKENKVHIHYNGWGTRWDEWIIMDSDRIQLFRTYTTQSTLFHHHSPYPVNKPDESIKQTDNEGSDFFEM